MIEMDDWFPKWINNLCGAKSEEGRAICLLDKGHESLHRAPSPNPKYSHHILDPEKWIAWSAEPIMVRRVSEKEKEFRENNL